jgi:toxin ParE1/3/4
MQIVFHPKVYSDIDKIMAHYERVAGSELADDFYTELRAFMVKVAGNPKAYPVRMRDMRRVNLHRFPYNFLFRISGDDIRVLVVRHHRRHPNFGTRRR